MSEQQTLPPRTGGDFADQPHAYDPVRQPELFDGVIFKDTGGTLRFADAPEVKHTAERGVVLCLTAAEASRLGPPEKGHLKFGPNRSTGRLSRLFGRGWKKN